MSLKMTPVRKSPQMLVSNMHIVMQYNFSNMHIVMPYNLTPPSKPINYNKNKNRGELASLKCLLVKPNAQKRKPHRLALEKTPREQTNKYH